jgi:deoxyuridine 5'-triphosphate nucleotidohydrolase
MIFTKKRDVKSPARANPTDAGIDFFIPTYTPELKTLVTEKSMKVEAVDVLGITLAPGDNVLIPLGIRVMVDSGTALVAMNKSGVASKKGLLVGAAVIDEGYEGECHLNLINPTSETVFLDWDSKIIQFLQLKIDQHMPTEITKEEYEALCKIENVNTTRGAGGFGSTGVA